MLSQASSSWRMGTDMKESGKKAGSMVKERNSTQKESWLKKECFQKEFLLKMSE